MIVQVFGEIFRYNEELYVYLGSTEELVYAAKILNPEITLKIKNLDDKRAGRTDSSRTDGNKLYSYIILTTVGFNDYSAHLGNPPQDSEKDTYFDWIERSLNDTDRQALKVEILRDGSAAPKGLKKIVAELDI